MEKFKPLIIVLIVVFVFVFLYHGIYKMYWQFNNQDVSDYIKEEIAKLPEDKRAASYKIINDGVNDILSRRNQTKQVLAMAKTYGTPPEMELVHAAVMQAKNLGYLKY